MAYFTEAATGRRVSRADAHDHLGRRKPGFSEILEDGESVFCSIHMMDAAAPAAPKGLQRDAVESARKAWMADKANAYRTQRTSTAEPVAAASQPRSLRDAKAGVAEARRAWLADKANAYRGNQ
jgi:hypothetical protein